MAVVPASAPNSSDLEANQRFIDALADRIARGERPDEIARLIHPKDPRKRRYLRRKLWRIVTGDPRLAAAIYTRAHGELILGLAKTSEAVAGRGARGRIDAAKLLYEASGFHNPRVKHEHTGDIRIKLELPRPKFDADAQVTDAEVVP